jgi:hypothetical protein
MERLIKQAMFIDVEQKGLDVGTRDDVGTLENWPCVATNVMHQQLSSSCQSRKYEISFQIFLALKIMPLPSPLYQLDGQEID